PFEVSSLGDGGRTFVVRSYDIAGNMTSTQFDWTIDLVPPVLTLTSVPAPFVNVASQQLTFDATDLHGIDRFECSLNGSAFEVCTSPYSFTAVVGDNEVRVRAYDRVGHTHELSTSFLLDIEIPVITLTSHPPAITASSTA